jgi:hypothetical protein
MYQLLLQFLLKGTINSSRDAAGKHNRYVDVLRSLQDIAFTFRARNSLERSSQSLENTHSFFVTARLPSFVLCTMDQKPSSHSCQFQFTPRTGRPITFLGSCLAAIFLFCFYGMEERYCHDKDLNAGRA